MIIPSASLLLPSSVTEVELKISYQECESFSPMGKYFMSVWSKKSNHYNFNLFPPRTFLTGTLPVNQSVGGEIL